MTTEDLIEYNLNDLKFAKNLVKSVVDMMNESPYELDDVVSILKVLPIENLSIDNLRSLNIFLNPDLSNPFITEDLRNQTIDLGELFPMEDHDLGMDAAVIEILDKDLSQESYSAVMTFTMVAVSNPSGGYQVVTRSAVILPTEDHKRSFEYISKLHLDRLMKYIVSECSKNKTRSWDGRSPY
jgi:hypothetical protein